MQCSNKVFTIIFKIKIFDSLSWCVGWLKEAGSLPQAAAPKLLIKLFVLSPIHLYWEYKIQTYFYLLFSFLFMFFHGISTANAIIADSKISLHSFFIFPKVEVNSFICFHQRVAEQRMLTKLQSSHLFRPHDLASVAAVSICAAYSMSLAACRV